MAVMSNSFVFIMIAAGLRVIICQGWPRHCCHTSLVRLVQAVCNKYCISRPIRCNPPSEKCDLNSTCVLCAEGKYCFQNYKYPYVCYTTSLSWDSEICFQIMRYGITACERLTFLSRDLPWGIHCNTYFLVFKLLQ